MQENLDQSRVVNTEENPEVDLRQLVYVFIHNWYWFLISAIIMLIAGYFYLKTKTPVYEAKASVLINRSRLLRVMFLLQELDTDSRQKQY